MKLGGVIPVLHIDFLDCHDVVGEERLQLAEALFARALQIVGVVYVDYQYVAGLCLAKDPEMVVGEHI